MNDQKIIVKNFETRKKKGMFSILNFFDDPIFVLLIFHKYL